MREPLLSLYHEPIQVRSDGHRHRTFSVDERASENDDQAWASQSHRSCCLRSLDLHPEIAVPGEAILDDFLQP
jgi:hypothetical protein